MLTLGKSSEIVIYEGPDKEIKIDVRLENDTVWLSQIQIATLFDIDRSVITKHIRNVFRTLELVSKSNVQKLHIANSDRPITIYSLDTIISVGYRVNSVRATQFRIWATKTLKNYLVKGYVINEHRLLEVQHRFKELQTTINFIEDKSNRKLLEGHEKDLLYLLSIYSKTLEVLENFDLGIIKESKGTKTEFTLTYEECIRIVHELAKAVYINGRTGDFFGVEREDGFKSVICGLYQTYDGNHLYETIEDIASNLLYLLIKDHPFLDGNKRSAAFLFVYYLDKNNLLYKKTGEKKINDNALIAICLLVAESDPKEKDILVGVIKTLISEY